MFPVKSFLGNFYRHLATFYWSHCPLTTTYGTRSHWPDARDCPTWSSTCSHSREKWSELEIRIFNVIYLKALRLCNLHDSSGSRKIAQLIVGLFMLAIVDGKNPFLWLTPLSSVKVDTWFCLFIPCRRVATRTKDILVCKLSTSTTEAYEDLHWRL